MLKLVATRSHTDKSIAGTGPSSFTKRHWQLTLLVPVVKIMISNKLKQKCKRGHVFTTENTRITKNGWRLCRKCRKEIRNKCRKDDYLWSRYRMRKPQLDEMLYQQKHCCYVCSKKPNKLQIDHDHKCCKGQKSCGKCIRALLCLQCNAILGLANDSTDLLQKLAVYVSEHKRK